MERYRPASHSERIVCSPPASAVSYREEAATSRALEPTFPVTPSVVLFEHQSPPDNEPSVELDPPLKSDRTQPLNHTTTSDIINKLRTPYDDYERHLAYWSKRLKHTGSDGTDTLDTPPAVPNPTEPCSYSTIFGTVSFAELVEHTRKYTASVLRNTYQVSEADIDDGLQAGYLRLWQRLQAEPELLQDKSLAWVGKGITYTALHATRSDWQLKRRTHTNGDISSAPQDGFTAHSRESRCADIRVDIHQAITTVAEQILEGQSGKRQDYDVWALYGLTMLHASTAEMSRLFQVREHTMQAAYRRVRERLQQALPNYVPSGERKLFRQHGRQALPKQDIDAIRQANGKLSEETYQAVRDLIGRTNADTRWQDEAALEGIRLGLPASVQSRAYGIPQHRMQRAYHRVHLLIGVQRDPTIRMRRPERRVKPVFTLTEEIAAAVEQLALDLLKQPRSYEKLVALHAHIGNLAISTTAKQFNIPTSTLRYYAQQIGRQLHTPTMPARAMPEMPLDRVT